MSIDTTVGETAVITPTKRKRPSARVVLMGTAALLLLSAGYGIGSAGAAPAPPPAPVEVVKTVEVPGPVKDKTPASCITALELADQALTLGGDSLKTVSGAITDALDSRFSKVTEATAHLKENTDKVKAMTPGYQAAKASCNAAA